MTNLRFRTLLSASVLSLAAMTAHAATSDPAAAALRQQLSAVGVATFTAPDYKPGTVRHVVLLRFRSGLASDKKAKIIADFLALKHTALRDGQPYIESVETGPQISGEGASHGLEHAFLLTFKSQGDRNYFIGTPIVTDKSHYDAAHAALKVELLPALAKNGLVSFDYPVTPGS